MNKKVLVSMTAVATLFSGCELLDTLNDAANDSGADKGTKSGGSSYVQEDPGAANGTSSCQVTMEIDGQIAALCMNDPLPEECVASQEHPPGNFRSDMNCADIGISYYFDTDRDTGKTIYVNDPTIHPDHSGNQMSGDPLYDHDWGNYDIGNDAGGACVLDAGTDIDGYAIHVCAEFIDENYCQSTPDATMIFNAGYNCLDMGMPYPITIPDDKGDMVPLYTDSQEMADAINNNIMNLDPNYISGGACIHDLNNDPEFNGLDASACAEFVPGDICTDDGDLFIDNTDCISQGFNYSISMPTPNGDMLIYADSQEAIDIMEQQ